MNRLLEVLLFGQLTGLGVGLCIGILYMEWVFAVNPNYRRIINWKKKK